MLRSLLLISFFSTLFSYIAYGQCNVSAGRDTTICVNSILPLNGTHTAATGVTYSYSWTSSGGIIACGSCQTTTFTSTTAGTYNVSFKVTSTSGTPACNETQTIKITVISKISANFTFAPDNVCSGTTVNFTAGTSGGVYRWDFGDPGSGSANTSTSQNPQHVFSSNGATSFNVKLVTGVPGGCADSVTKKVTVIPAPQAKLIDKQSNFTNCDGQAFTLFVSDSTVPAGSTNYKIVWGDGSPNYQSATAPNNTSHTYTSQGVFTLVYSVTGPNGCVGTQTIQVANITNPGIGVQTPPGTQGCGPLKICFPITGFSQNHSSTKYIVDFGDGTPPATYNHPPPSSICHDYVKSSCPIAGKAYTFRITASNNCDSSVATVTPIRVYDTPATNVYNTDTVFCVNKPVQFYNASTGYNHQCNDPTFKWSWGDGTNDELAPGNTSKTHTYTTTGKFLVKLSGYGCDTVSDSMYVYIENPVVASIKQPGSTACTGVAVQFDDNSNFTSGYRYSRYWTVDYTPTTNCSPGSASPTYTSGTPTSQQIKLTFTEPGRYRVILHSVNSCGEDTASSIVDVAAKPRPAINPIAGECIDKPLDFSAVYYDCGAPITTYAWTFTGATPSSSSLADPAPVTYSTSGSKTVTVNATNSCGTGTDNIQVEISSPPPAPSPGGQASVCEGDAIRWACDGASGATFRWSGPNNYSSSPGPLYIYPATTSHAGTYYVTQYVDGCKSKDSTAVVVEVRTIPKTDLTANRYTICQGDSTMLHARGADSYYWPPNTNATAKDSIVRPLVNTQYVVTGFKNNCAANDTINIVVKPAPVAEAGADRTECNQPQPIQLSGTPSGGTWSGPNTTSSGQFTPNGTGTFKIFYSVEGANACTGKDSLTITVVNPTPSNAGPDRKFCQNDPPYIINGTPAPGTWTGPKITSNGQFNPDSVGVVTVTYSQGSGSCKTSDQAVITVNARPAVTAQNDVSKCTNDPAFSLTASPTGGTWTGSGVSSSGNFNPGTSGAGTYTLTYTYTDPSTNCSNSDIVVVTINAVTPANAGPDTTLCNQPVPTQLGFSPAGGTWTGPNISSSGVFTPNGTGTFTDTYTFTNNFGCVSTDTRVVTVIAPTPASAGPDVTKCIGSPAFNLPGSPSPGTWSGTGVTSAGSFNPNTAGTFTVTYSQGKGSCLTSDDVVVTVNPLPTVNAGPDLSTCFNTPAFNLSANPPGGTWSGTGVTSSGTFTPSTAGVGSHTISYFYTHPSTNCSNTDVIVIRVNPNPTVNAGPDTTICNQALAAIFRGTPNGGTWSGSGIASNGTFTPPSAGTFPVTYTYTNSFNCSGSDQMNIIVVDPVYPNAGADVSVCIGSGNLTMSASPTGGSWSGANVTSAGIFSPVTAGDYVLTYAIGPGNCRTTDDVKVTVLPLPIVSAGPAQAVCIDAAAFPLTGSPTGGSWSGTGVSPSGSFDPALAGSGTKTITYSYTDPTTTCSNSSSFVITVNPLPAVNAGADRQECDQAIPVTLNGSPTGGTWSGSNVTSSGTFTPNGTGTFTLTYTYTNGNGCTSSDQLNITVVPATYVTVGADTAICRNSPILNLTGTPGGGSWTGTGVTTAGSFNPQNAGTFNLTYSLGTGSCKTTASQLITVNALPTLNVGPAASDCIDKATYPLSFSPTGGTWSGVGVSPAGVFSPGTAGQGTFVLRYDYTDPTTGCFSSVTKTMSVNPLPNVNAGPDKTLCNQPVVEHMTGTPVGGTWTGPDVSPGGDYTPNGNGVYNLTYTYTDPKGCVNSDFAQVTVADAVQAVVGADFAECFGTPDVTLQGTPSGGSWSGSRITTGGRFNAQQAGTFVVTYTYGSGTCKSSDDMVITVHPLPVITSTVANTCTNIPSIPLSNLNVNPVGGNFSGTGVDNPTQSFLTAGLAAGSYDLNYTFTDGNGCTNTHRPKVIINAIPVISAGPDQQFCSTGIPGQLYGTPANGIWSGNAVSPNGFYPTNNAVTDSTVVYSFTDSKGCVNKDTTVVAIIQPATVSTSNDTSICLYSQDLQVLATPPGGTWSGQHVTSNGLFNPVELGSFVLTYTYGTLTCKVTSDVTISVDSIPELFIGPDTLVCDNSGDFVLRSNHPGTGTWSGPGVVDPVAGSFSPAMLNAGMYPVLFSYTSPATGCSNISQQIITINPKPVVLTAGTDTICDQSNPITFNGSPAGGTWTGSNITPGGTYTPGGTGTTNLVYSYTDNFGCSNFDVLKVVTISTPVVNAGLDTNLCASPVAIQIPASPAGGAWSGDPAIDAQGRFIPSVGNYTFTYTLTKGSCVVSDQRNVKVNPLPTVSTSPISPVCNNLPVFSLVAYGSPAGGMWTGNGVAANSFDPSLVAAGDKVLTYTYTDPSTGCSDQAPVTVKVLPLPVPNFNAPSLACKNQSVPFTDQSTNTATYFWNFGDNGTSTIPSPSHSYPTVGTYTVQLLATASNGCQASTTKQLEVIDKPVAHFQMSDTAGCNSATVDFTEDGYSPYSSYNWNFGNTQTYSGATPPSVFYNGLPNGNKTYIITLAVSNQCGSSNFVDSVIIANSVPTAAFNTATDTVCAKAPLNLQNQSSSNSVFFNWNFGDGNSSGLKNPGSHTYATFPTDTSYIITLEVENGCGKSSSSKTIVVVPAKPSAFANAGPTKGCVPFVFNATSTTVGAESIYWNFGDNNFEVTNQVSHTFDTPGSYQVQLVATNRCSSDIAYFPIVVHPKPVPQFVTNGDIQCGNDTFALKNTTNGNTTSYWTSSDLQTCSNRNWNKLFTAPGSYQVQLRSTDVVTGCMDSTSKTVTVLQFPKPDITPFDTIICQNEPIQFMNQSLDVDQYTWYFGDETNSTDTFPEHYYNSPGQYHASVTLLNSSGCTDTVGFNITILPRAYAGFELNPSVIDYDYEGTDVVCNATNFDAASYFLDGEYKLFSCEGHINTDSLQPGSYMVYQEVTTELGCRDSAVRMLTLNPESHVYIPNSFSPDDEGDVRNNTFYPVIMGYESFSLVVVDRWGRVVYQTSDPTARWNGKHLNSGEYCKSDTYIWTFKGTTVMGKQTTQQGQVTLLR